MICLDASFVGTLLSPDEEGDRAFQHLQRFEKEGETFVAPSLLVFEVLSLLQKKVRRKIMDRADFLTAVEQFRRLEVELVLPDDLMEMVAFLADTFPSASTYDLSYLATAKSKGIPLYTSDKKFFQQVHPAFSLVHLV